MTNNHANRLHQLAVTLLTLSVFAVGCTPSTEQSKTESRETTTQQLDQVKQDATNAALEMKDFTYAQKAEFVAHMKTELGEINQDLDQLAAKIQKASDAAQAEAKPKLQALRDQTAKLNKQLEEAENATESTWNDVKVTVKKGYSELKDGFRQSRQWLSEKIAP